MKKLFLIPLMAVALIAPVSGGTDTPAKVTTVAAPPQIRVLEVTAAATEFEPVQARWMNGAGEGLDKRGVSQMFSWIGTKPLTSIGLRMDPLDSPVNKAFVAPQAWVIDFQELDAQQKVVGLVTTLKFRLTPRDFNAGGYLVVTPATPVPLKAGRRYGFHLRPEAVVDLQRLLISRTTKEGAELGAGGNQTGGNLMTGYGQPQGDSRYDLVFFLTQ